VKSFNEFNNWVVEKDEHKKSSTYKKLTPKMKKVIDEVFNAMEKNPSDFLSTFDKTVSNVAKKHGVKEKDIMNYFDKEMLTI
jgi:rRNA maturation endonuclease Nob1